MVSKNPLIIAIDGPSGSGKSSVAKRLAIHFKLPCLDTGAMYRAVALECIENQISLSDEKKIAEVAKSLDFEFGVTNETLWAEMIHPKKGKRRLAGEIRTPEVSMGASAIAKWPELRAVLVSKQQVIGAAKGAVVEGRDAGTVIFPKAKFKFFVTAAPEERASRRYQELSQISSKAQSYEEVLRDVVQRDKQDAERAVSPLKPAEDATIIDTSGLNLDEVVQSLIKKITALSGQ